MAKQENLRQVNSAGTIRLRTAQEVYDARSIAEAGYGQLGVLEIERQVVMKNSLVARRRKAVRNLDQVNRKIEAEEKGLKQIEARLAVLAKKGQKAA
jgi:hypothetical protein